MKKLLLAVCVIAASTLAYADRPAEEVFNKHCTVCHTPGIANAPKVHDVAAWKPVLEKGTDKLMQSIHNGINAMPPMGTCMDCTDKEFLELIDYMATAKE